MSLVRAANPIWYMVDLTGVALNDNYWAFFLANTLPYIFQPVFQDPNSISPWSDPLQFQPSGTLPNNLYFDPALTYRIEIRKGPNQSDPLIWLIENFVPGNGGTQATSIDFTGAQNLITNPQFADIDFESPLTYTQGSSNTYTVDVAPGWQLVLVGAGTSVLTQVAIPGDTWPTSVPGNAPFALEIANSGWNSAKLIQTFVNNGEIFSNGAISMSVTAVSSSIPQNITLSYVPSGTPNPTVVVSSQSVGTGVYSVISNSVDVNSPSVNTNTGLLATVQMVITLPPAGTMTITNVQFLGQSTPLASTNPVIKPTFQEISYERVIDQEFHVYKHPLFYKQIPSYLVGWDFPLNPAQFLGDSVAAQAVGANKSYYAWDQTILFQSANSGITTTRGSSGDLKLLAAAATQIAVIQYLPQVEARKILNDLISVNLSAVSNKSGGLPLTISLWYTKGSALPSCIGSNASIVATLDVNGKPDTFNNPTGGTWIEVTPLNKQDAICTVESSSTTNFNDYSFNGFWDISINADADLATFFAIVIGTSAMAISDYIRINSVGLCSGSIATRPAPQTQDEALRCCQYYYEMSYPPGEIPNVSVSLAGQRCQVIGIEKEGGDDHLYHATFGLTYDQVKVNTPTTVVFYAPGSATANKILGIIAGAGGAASASATQSEWTLSSASIKSLLMSATTNTAIIGIATDASNYGTYQFHYTLDSRLGQ